MFDIKEYYYNYQYQSPELTQDVADFDDDVAMTIDNLVSDRLDSIYLHDRYKHLYGTVEIIHPSLQYPKNLSLMMTPDKVRYLLSFYPRKKDLVNIQKIVMRPRYIEIAQIELTALYLRNKQTLVIYLFHPHYYRVSETKTDIYQDIESSEIDRLNLVSGTNTRSPLFPGQSEFYIHPLWYVISLVERENSDTVDKFFIRRSVSNNSVYDALNDISFFYSQHGY